MQKLSHFSILHRQIMPTNRVLHFCITLAVIFLGASSVTSSQCDSCPCGSSGQNYTHCFHEALDDHYTCDRWANCQTCAANTTLCSCPPDRFGPACLDDCGRISQRTNRIPSSTLNAGDWPWTIGIAAVSPEDVENVFCGGVILNKETVLTAAQCVTGTQKIVLLSGTTYPTPTGDSGSEQKRRISQIILYPDFDNETKSNDIALLKFTPELNFTQTIQPICLRDHNTSDANLLPGQKGLIPGWGYNYTMYMFIPAVKYQVANVSVQPDDKCTESCIKQGLSSCSTSEIFCADYPNGVDACMYRGAPMVIHDVETERYTLAGLVTQKLTANERNCRRGETDTVFANVSHYMQFILDNMS